MLGFIQSRAQGSKQRSNRNKDVRKEEKFALMRRAIHDTDYLADLEETMKAFSPVDYEKHEER